MNPQLYDEYRYQEVLVSPMYLAGSNGNREAGFAPVARWPHHYLDEGPCQLLVTSPVRRIRIGWFGDDFELWRITAAEEAVPHPGGRRPSTMSPRPRSSPVSPPFSLTTTPKPMPTRATGASSQTRRIAGPTLSDTGWTHDGGAELGTVEIIAPDGQAGVLIDTRRSCPDDEAVTLWAGPPGWGTRAEAAFSARTPSHLIAATAAAMADPAPAARERHQIHREVEHLVSLTPIGPTAPQAPRAPTPLDVRRTAVTQAVNRAALFSRTAADLRVMAARSRTAAPTQNRSRSPAPGLGTRSPASTSAPRRSR